MKLLKFIGAGGILLVALVAILFGCGSSKTTVISEENIVHEDTTWKNLSYLHGMKVKLTDMVSTDMGVRIRYTKYDTSKPKDKETGLPPVEEEGEIGLDFNQEQKTDADVADSTQFQSDGGSSSRTESDKSTEEVKEREETNVINDLKWLAILIVVIAVILTIYRLRKKIFSRFS